MVASANTQANHKFNLSHFAILSCTHVTELCHGIISKFLFPGVMRFVIWESILSGRRFRCSTIYANRSFHRSVHAIFGKVGRIASEEVLIELIKCNCMPILLYGIECFFLPKSDVKSLDFVVTRFLMKLFRTVNHDVMRDCCMYLGFTLPSDYLVKKYQKFILRYKSCSN